MLWRRPPKPKLLAEWNEAKATTRISMQIPDRDLLHAIVIIEIPGAYSQRGARKLLAGAGNLRQRIEENDPLVRILWNTTKCVDSMMPGPAWIGVALWTVEGRIGPRVYLVHPDLKPGKGRSRYDWEREFYDS